MIEKLVIEGFGGIERTVLRELSPVTLLTGKGGSGKTGVLRAVHAWAAGTDLQHALGAGPGYRVGLAEDGTGGLEPWTDRLTNGGTEARIETDASWSGPTRVEWTAKPADEEGPAQLSAVADGGSRRPEGRHAWITATGNGGGRTERLAVAETLVPGDGEARLAALWTRPAESGGLHQILAETAAQLGVLEIVAGRSDGTAPTRAVLRGGQRTPIGAIGSGALRLALIAGGAAAAAGGYLLIEGLDTGDAGTAHGWAHALVGGCHQHHVQAFVETTSPAVVAAIENRSARPVRTIAEPGGVAGPGARRKSVHV